MKRNVYLIISISAIAALLMFSVIGIYRIMSSDDYSHNRVKSGVPNILSSYLDVPINEYLDSKKEKKIIPLSFCEM